ncbi:hypothetical protein D3C73_1442620 [compost metagenome]
MCWRNLVKLIYRFQHQRAVALHNPQRDLFIAFPGRILHHDPAMLFSLFGGHTHGIVVVHIDNLRRRAFIANCGQTLLR